MNTKNIFKHSLIALGMLGVASCSLDTESMTDLNDQTAYRNQEAVEMALVGCYDGWQATTSNQGVGMYLMAEMASDQAHAGLGLSDAKNNNVIDQFDLGIAPSYNDLFNTDWINYYKAIFRCNKIIENADKTQFNSETDKGRILGETRALRAIQYFDLARLFGDVPLITAPTSENIARTPASEVYQLIISDLKYAAENIPADAYPKAASNSNDGRITKYAAEALLARVYLYYTGYYGEEPANCTKQDAIDALKDIIAQEGKEFALEKEYKNLFMPACTKDASSGSTYAYESTYAGKYYNNGWTGTISKEVILNLKFAATMDYNGNADGNTFCVYLGPRNKCATSVLVASGWGCCSVTKAFVDKYKGDPRFSACAWSCDEKGFAADVADSYEYTGYYTLKYAPMCFADGTRQEVGFNLGEAHQNITYYQDWTIMRYADVLLMAAELGLDAQQNFNKVYHRAHDKDFGATPTIEDIRNERAIEFAFEGIHFWDLMRYEKDGAYAARAIYAAQNGANVKNGGEDAKTSFNMQNFTSKKGLMQIPNTQITLSGGVLTQNAGW